MNAARSPPQLRAFVALAEQRNFTRAAQPCHLSQPAFSALIRTLEDDARARACSTATRAACSSPPKGGCSRPGAARCCDDMRGARWPTCATTRRARRGPRGDRAAAVAGGRLAAGDAGAGSMQRYPGIALELADALSDALHRARAQRPGRLRARRDARRHAASCAPSSSAATASTWSAGRPSAGQRRSRVEPATWRRPSSSWRATSSVRQYVDAALHPLPLTHGDGGRPARHGGRLVRAGLGISVVPALTLFHFGGARPWPRGRCTRRGWCGASTWCARADRPLSFAAAGLHEMLMAAKPRGVHRRTP